MPGTVLAQQAFKAALLGGSTNLNNIADLRLEAEKFKERFNNLLPNENLSNAALVAGVLATTVAALGAAYLVIKNRVDYVNDEREGFIDSVDKHVVSFFITHDKYSRRETVKYVAAFIEIVEQNPILNQYARLFTQNFDGEDRKGIQYNAFSIASLPFGANFDQPREDGDNVDEAIQYINLFLSGEFSKLLAAVKEGVDHNFINNAKLMFDAQNYIQDLNATRLIAICVTNIAINLIQGINPNTSLPLTTYESYKYCGEFRSVLLKLKTGINEDLNKVKNNLKEAHSLDKFIENLEDRVNFLQQAYKDKLRNDFNLDDVINSGYSVIQNSTRPIRRFLYLDGRLENPAMFFSNLIELNIEIKNNPQILTRLVKKLSIPADSDFSKYQINNPPCTVIDLLAIYASRYRDVRETALNRFKRPEDIDFKETLKYFDDNYIKYIEDQTKSYSWLGRTSHAINPAREYLLYFVALMLETYNVTLIENDLNSGNLKANDQAFQILKKILDGEQYYSFKYLMSNDAPSNFQDYLLKQINLVIEIRHLALIATLSEINSSHLQRLDFQVFIRQRLIALQKKIEEFIDAKDKLIERAAKQNSSNNDTKLILSEIDQVVPNKFTKLPDLCENLINDLNRSFQKINNPQFQERLKVKEVELVKKMQFYDLNNTNANFYTNLHRYVNYKNDAVAEMTNIENVQEDIETASVTSTGSNSDYAPLQLKLLNAVCIASVVLLVIGLALLLTMHYGINSCSILANLASDVRSALVITGFVCVATAGLGLPTSYYAASFFDRRSFSIPINEDRLALSNFLG